MGGLIADLVAANRMVLEDIRTRQVMQGLDRARSTATAAQGGAGGDTSQLGAQRRARKSVKLV